MLLVLQGGRARELTRRLRLGEERWVMVGAPRVIRQVLRHVIAGDLEWGYHESDSRFKMAAYARAAYGCCWSESVFGLISNVGGTWHCGLRPIGRGHLRGPTLVRHRIKIRARDDQRHPVAGSLRGNDPL